MPSSSLLLRAGALLTALSSTTLATKYTVQDTYQGSTFLDDFTFFTDADPTNGFVQYTDKVTAGNQGLVKMIGGDNYIGVDHTTTLDHLMSPGRKSIRIEGAKTYTHGLFVLDLKHMPGGICGTWPAFWSYGGQPWPVSGEIDIIEGVNQNNANKMVLHTDTQCSVSGVGQTDPQNLYNCALDSASGASGCDVNAVEANTFGTGFNANGGGVYAMEWTSDFIKMWFFPRGHIPASIQADKPDTADFGLPNANFQGACNIDQRFMHHHFIFDNTFCGDWAGNVYSQSGCPQYPGLGGMDSCKKFVAENPSAFTNAYWLISYFKTYVVDTSVTSSSSSSSVASSTASSTVSSPSSASSPISSSSASSSSISSSASVSSSVSSASASTTPISTPSGSSSQSYSPSSSAPVNSYRDGSYASSPGNGYGSGPSSAAGYGAGSQSSHHAYITTSPVAGYGNAPSSAIPSGFNYARGGCDTRTHGISSKPTSTPVHGNSSTSTYTPHAASSSPVGYGYESHETSSNKLSSTSTPCASSKSSTISIPSYETKTASTNHPEYPTTTPAVSTPKAFTSSHASSTISTYTTTYVDICSTGYTTKTITQTVTIPCSTGTASYASVSSYAPPPGFTVMTKICTACAATPITVTLTVPRTVTETRTATASTAFASKPASSQPAYPIPASSKPAPPANATTPSYNHGTTQHNSFPTTPTPTVVVSKISTLYVYPSPAPPAVVSPKPLQGLSCTGSDCSYAGANVTMSFATGTGSGSASKTSAYNVPYFTGAAAGVQVGGVLAGGVAAVVAMLL